MRTVAVTGSASGIGAAVAARLRSAGDRVIGVDLRDAEVIADLSSGPGRADAVTGVAEACGGVLDGLVTCAGVGGLPGRPGSLLVEVNYCGTVQLLAGLRPALAAAAGAASAAGGASAAAVAIASNSTTIHPDPPLALTDACVAGDLPSARRLADEAGPVAAYPATKVAVCRWLRRQAPSKSWAGAGIRLNAVAPGAVETPLLAEQRNDARIAPLIEGLPIPLGRPGLPDEVAAVVAFLLSPDASLLCGSILLADGGTESLLRADAYPTPWHL